MYDNMTLAELEQAIQAIGAQRDALKAQAGQIQLVIDRKTAKANAQRLIANLGDADKAALLQAIQGSGIPSGEVVKGLQ